MLFMSPLVMHLHIQSDILLVRLNINKTKSPRGYEMLAKQIIY